MTKGQAEKLNEENKLEGMVEIDNEDYHRGPGISSSNLIDIEKFSVRHMKHWKENPEEPTKAMRDGTRLHTAVLEPHLFDQIYAVAPTLDKRFKENKELIKKFEDENVGKIFITNAEYENTMRMRDAVMEHPVAKQFFDGAIIEKAFYWKDPDTGVLCKARPDIVNHRLGMLIDLKKTTDATEWNIRSSVKNFKYYMQAAFHKDGVNLCNKDQLVTIHDSVFVFVEDTAPYGVQVVAISLNDLQKGFDEYKDALTKYAEAVKTGKWPGYEQKILELTIFNEGK